MKGGWEGRERKRGSCVVSLYVKRLAELQSPLSEQVLTTWRPPSLPLTLFFSLRWWNGQCGAGPSLPLTAGIIIFPAHTPKTHDAILIKPCWRDTAKITHTSAYYTHTHTHYLSQITLWSNKRKRTSAWITFYWPYVLNKLLSPPCCL